MNRAVLRLLVSLYGPNMNAGTLTSGPLGQAIINYHAGDLSQQTRAPASPVVAAKSDVGATIAATASVLAPSLEPLFGSPAGQNNDANKFPKSIALFGMPKGGDPKFQPWMPTTLLSLPGGRAALEQGQRKTLFPLA